MKTTQKRPMVAPPQEGNTSIHWEWSAVVLGTIIGFVWWVLHRTYFVDWYWFLVPVYARLGLTIQTFDILYLWLNATTALVQGLTVGFVVGAVSRRHPYLLCLVAMLLALALKPLHDFFDLWNDARPPYHAGWAAAVLVWIYVGAPFLGAHISQKLKPNPETLSVDAE